MLDCKGTTFHDFMQKLVPEISNLLMESEIPVEPIYTTWPQMYRVTLKVKQHKNLVEKSIRSPYSIYFQTKWTFFYKKSLPVQNNNPFSILDTAKQGVIFEVCKYITSGKEDGVSLKWLNWQNTIHITSILQLSLSFLIFKKFFVISRAY